MDPSHGLSTLEGCWQENHQGATRAALWPRPGLIWGCGNKHREGKWDVVAVPRTITVLGSVMELQCLGFLGKSITCPVPECWEIK